MAETKGRVIDLKLKTEVVLPAEIFGFVFGPQAQELLTEYGRKAGYDRTTGEPLNIQLVFEGRPESIPGDWQKLYTGIFVGPELEDRGVPGIWFLPCVLMVPDGF